MNFIHWDAVTRSLRLQIRGLPLFALLCGFIPSAAQAAFQDTLDFPASSVGRLDQRPMQAIGTAGKRLVAVGARGVIALSDDRGQTWSQSSSPVQSDLVAVHFPTANSGWAVGHDGVVLHTNDAGKTWQKQLDGRAAKAAFTQYYKAGAEAGNAAHKAALVVIERNYKAGSSLPFLDVWFDDDKNGFVVGAFGLIIATTDGGRTWVPWVERIDNPESLHLNAIRGGDGGVYIAAERGAIFRLDRAKDRFALIPTGYAGSFFGLVVSQTTIVAFGLRGTVYRTADRGQTWQAATVPSHTTITGGTVLAGSGGFVLVNIGGEMLTSDSSGMQFAARKTEKPWRYTGIVPLQGDKIALTSMEGMRVEALK